MSNENKEFNLDLKELRLTSLSVEEYSGEKTTERNNEVELLHFDENTKILELKYTDELISHTKINLELVALMEIEGDVTTKDIEEIMDSEEIEDFAYPLLTESSHIISFITSKAEAFPIIVPPTFKNFN